MLRRAPPDLTGLFSIFGTPIEEVPHARFFPAADVPQPYRRLLAHDNHMTVTMEEHVGSTVDLEVIRDIREDPWYARKILLRSRDSGRVAMFGIMRFNFEWCSDDVRDEIIAHTRPLGHILIEHDVMRRISTHALMQIRPNSELTQAFDLNQDDGAEPTMVYGRLATIYCNEAPAVDLLEIPAPD